MPTPCQNCGATNSDGAAACARCQQPLDASHSGKPSAGSSSARSPRARTLALATISLGALALGAWLAARPGELGGDRVSADEDVAGAATRSAEGSSAGEEAPGASATPDGVSPNGVSPNGVSPNGVSSNPAAPTTATGTGSPTAGELPRELIQAGIHRGAPAIRACFERGLQRTPDLAGTVNVAFVIGPDGNVTQVGIESSTLGDKDVEECIAASVGALTFPRPAGGGEVKIRYPFALNAGGDGHKH